MGEYTPLYLKKKDKNQQQNQQTQGNTGESYVPLYLRRQQEPTTYDNKAMWDKFQERNYNPDGVAPRNPNKSLDLDPVPTVFNSKSNFTDLSEKPSNSMQNKYKSKYGDFQGVNNMFNQPQDPSKPKTGFWEGIASAADEGFDQGYISVMNSLRLLNRKLGFLGFGDGLDEIIKKDIEDKEKESQAERESRAGNKGIQKFAESAVTGTSAMIPAITGGQVLGTAAGASGLANLGSGATSQLMKGLGAKASQTIIKVAQTSPFFLQSMGGYAREAELEGADEDQQFTYGVVGGIVETVTEAPMLNNWLDGKRFGLQTLANKAIMKSGAKNLTKILGASASDYALSVLGEAAQEMMTEPMTGTAKKLIYDKDMPWAGEGGVIDTKAIGEAGYGGAAMGVLMTALGLPNTIRTTQGEVKSEARAKAEAIAKENRVPSEEEVKDLEQTIQREITGYLSPPANMATPQAVYNVEGLGRIEYLGEVGDGINVLIRDEKGNEHEVKKVFFEMTGESLPMGTEDFSWQSEAENTENSVDNPVDNVTKEGILSEEQTYLRDFAEKNNISIDELMEETKGNMKSLEDEHIEYLKSSGGRGTSKEVMTIQDELGRDQGKRTVMVSENPGWYSEFYKKNGRKPTKKDLEILAKEHLENGFKDTAGEVPANESYINYKKQLGDFETIKKHSEAKISEINKPSGEESRKPSKDESAQQEKDRKKTSGATEKLRAATHKKAFEEGLKSITGFTGEKVRAQIIKPQNDVQDALVSFMKQLGVDVVLYKSDSTFGEDEFVNSNHPNIIFVRETNISDITWATGHGFLHTLRKNHPDLYKGLVEAIKPTIKDAQVEAYIETFSNEEYREMMRKNKDAVIEEMIADEMGNSFTDKKFWEQVYKKDKNLFHKIVDVFMGLFDKLLARNYENYLDSNQVSDLRKGFVDAVAEIIKNNEGEAVATQFASRNKEERLKDAVSFNENGRAKVDVDSLTKTELTKIASGIKALGYDWRSAEDARELLSKMTSRGTYLNEDQTEVVKRVLGITKAEKVAANPNLEIVEKAKKVFGITGNFKEAGYLTLDGKLLDFSGKRDGGPAGYRYMDHREIQEVVDSEYSKAMYDFMDMGNIRMKPEGGGFELTQMPTEEQKAVLKRYIQSLNGEVFVDLGQIGKHNSNPEYMEYNRGTRAERIFADIEKFYKEGTKNESLVSQFHNMYSARGKEQRVGQLAGDLRRKAEAGLMDELEYARVVKKNKDLTPNSKQVIYDAIGEAKKAGRGKKPEDVTFGEWYYMLMGHKFDRYRFGDNHRYDVMRLQREHNEDEWSAEDRLLKNLERRWEYFKEHGNEPKFSVRTKGERDTDIVSEKGFTMPYRKNLEKAPYMGDMFGQDIEPSGDYISYHPYGNRFPNHEFGTITFNKPLIIDWETTGKGGWKTKLSERYKGRTGKALSNAIRKDGYDSIVAIDSEAGEIKEVVNLSAKREPEVNFSSREKDNRKNEEITISLGSRKLQVFKNPTDEQYWYLIEKFKEEHPFAPPGTPKVRTTYDEDGNTYIWNAYDAMHYDVEKYFFKNKGIKMNQNKFFDDVEFSAREKQEKNLYDLPSAYTEDEIQKIIRDYIKELENNFELEGLEYKITDIKVYGSRAKGNNRKKSDLDVLVIYDGRAREDDMFDALNNRRDRLKIDGIKVDFNPVQSYRASDYIENTLYSARDKQTKAPETSAEFIDYVESMPDDMFNKFSNYLADKFENYDLDTTMEGFDKKYAIRAIKNMAEEFDTWPGINSLADMNRLLSISTGIKFGEKPNEKVELPSTPRNKQTITPEFRKWFGDSKVVDENGNPLVVYHGTNFTKGRKMKQEGITTFGGNRNAHWFAKEVEHANYFTQGGRRPTGNKKGGNVIPAYLKIENPLDLRGKVDIWDEITGRELLRKAGVDEATIEEVIRTSAHFGMKPYDDDFVVDETGTRHSRRDFAEEEMRKGTYGRSRAFSWFDFNNFVDALRNNGIDGVIWSEGGSRDLISDTYAVFSPTQIKSATGNNGQFDENNPDIRFSGRNKELREQKRQYDNLPQGKREIIESFVRNKSYARIIPRKVYLDNGDVYFEYTEALSYTNIKRGYRLVLENGYRDAEESDISENAIVIRDYNEDYDTIPVEKKPITDTPAFKKWFDGSKVVTEDGEPLVVYHGTPKEFSKFDRERLGNSTKALTAKIGFFFTNNTTTAEKFSKSITNPFWGSVTYDGSNLMPVYLSLKSPLVFESNDGKDSFQAMKDYLLEFANENEVTWEYKFRPYKSFDDIAPHTIQKYLTGYLKNAGHDGIILKNTRMDGSEPHDFYIAFDSSQIKSATGNNGDFDSSNPDIRFSARNKAEKAEDIKVVTNKGSEIKRYKNNVGKDIGGQVYFHKDYAEEIVPPATLKKALEILKEGHAWFKYNTMVYDKKMSSVRFDEAPDFDSAREPIPGKYVKVNTVTGAITEGSSDSIWHHKWLWVKDDYKGFDVAGSKAWSREWTGKLEETAIGRKDKWDAQLKKYGVDEAKFSARDKYEREIPFVGVIGADGFVESYNYATAEKNDFHHNFIMSEKGLNAMEEDNVLRFVRYDGDKHYTLEGQPSLDPLGKGYKQIRQLARHLQENGVDAKTKLMVAKQYMDTEYEGKSIGTVGDFVADKYSARDKEERGWTPGRSYSEIKKDFPQLFEATADDNTTDRHPTQIAGTVSTYKQIFDFLGAEGFEGDVLDASSGLGYGTKAGREMGFNVDDVEPFPAADYKPKFTNYADVDKKYDVIISNAVLNVIPQDFRDGVTRDIGRLLKEGGRAFINVRGSDVLDAKEKVAIDADNWEYFMPSKKSYQKGFKKPEIVAYIEDILGDGFKVELMTPKNSGLKNRVGVVVTRENSKFAARQKSERADKNPNKWIHNSTMNSDFTPQEVKDIINEEYDEIEDTWHDIEHDDDNMYLAKQMVMNDFQGALDRVNSFETPENALDSALIIAIYQKYVQEERFKEAAAWNIKSAPKVKRAGQAIQILSVLKKMSREGIIRYAQKEIESKVSEDDKKKITKKIKELVDKMNLENEIALDKVTRELEQRDADEVLGQARRVAKRKKAEGIQQELEDTKRIPRLVRKKSDAKAEKQKKSPEEMLSSRVASWMMPGKKAKDDPIKAMVDTLFKVAKQTLPEKERAAHKTAIDFINAAMMDRNNYKDVWEKAQALVKEKFAGSPETLQELDEYFRDYLEKPFSDSQMTEAVRKGIKDLNINLAQLVRKHYSEVNKSGMELQDRLVAAGMGTQDALDLANYIADKFNELTGEKKEQILRDMFKERKAPDVREYYKRMIEISNLGGFEEQYRPYVAKKLGIESITPELAEKLSNMAEEIQTMEDGREKDKKVGLMMKAVSDEIPGTPLQKIATIQAMAQLLNLKTINRNLIGNTLMILNHWASEVVAAPLDFAISKTFGTERTTGLPRIGKYLQGGIRGGRISLEDQILGIDTLNGNNKHNLHGKRTFKSGPLSIAETAMNIALKTSDDFYKQGAIAESLYQQMKFKKVDTATEEMIEKAQKVADYLTFADDTILSKAASNLKRKVLNLDKDFGLGDILLKYPKVPANLIMRAIDYSPLGFIGAGYHMLSPIFKKGGYSANFNQKAFVDSFSRAAIGTLDGFLLGLWLASKGIITGDPDKDPDKRELERLIGLGEFKFNVSGFVRYLLNGLDEDAAKLQEGDKLINYDWIQPHAIMMSIGANIHANRNKPGKDKDTAMDTMNLVLEAINTGVDNLTNQPVTRGIKRFMQYRDTGDAITGTLKDIPSSFVWGFLNNIRNLEDNTKRETYSDKWFKEAGNKVKSRLPVISKKLPANLDVWGSEEEIQKGGATVWSAFMSPWNASTYKPTPEAKLALDIYEKTGEKIQFPRVAQKTIQGQDGASIRLTTEEYVWYQKYMGKNSKALYEYYMDKFSSPATQEEYTDWAKALKDGFTDIGQAAREKILKDRGVWVDKDK